MANHSSAKREFLRWVGSLDTQSLSDPEKQLLNLIIDHFDELSLLGTAGGSRARRLGKLIMEVGDTQSTEMPQITEESTSPEEQIRSLIEMKIGPFRGFKDQETFIFDRQYTFMYGPNGSGKSSFCEGLEFALLGGIEEAEAKRIPIDSYIKNEQASLGLRPELTVLLANGENKFLDQGNFDCRFSFVEKNRIDAFARISATTAKDQSNRISTLFGLDQFSQFVDGFTDDFDYRYLNLINNKALTFKKEEEQIESAKKRLETIEALIGNVPERISAIIQKLKEEGLTDIHSVKVFLTGENGAGGIIGRLLKEKVESIPNDLNDDFLDGTQQSYSQLIENLQSLENKLCDLGKVATQINYKDLYAAVQAIATDETTNKSQCPACKTPLESVASDPFKLAEKELQKMQQLTVLQSEIKGLCERVADCIRTLNRGIGQLNLVGPLINGKEALPCNVFSELPLVGFESIELWKPTLLDEMKSFKTVFDTFPALVDKIKQYNLVLEQRRLRQATIDAELQRYQGFKGQVDQLDAQVKIILEEKAEITRSINEFKSQNADKIKEIEDEQKVVDRDTAFKSAYDSLIPNLKRWRDHLPTLLSAGLSENTMKFYNVINDHDPEFEKLETLTLPKTAGEKIELKFIGDEKVYDALQILSDGHIKSLGLSLLLSKVVADNLGFVIYDDIVNAIDDDHRDGIASLLLESTELKDRQQIVTCHGEQFINKLAHKLGASVASTLVKDYRFTPVDCIEERGVRISIGDSRHYLLLANKFYEENSLKDCLSSCRRAIESVSEQLWKKLGKTLNINLSVQMRQPGARPDLSSVVDGMIKVLQKITFLDKSNLLVNFQSLKEKYNWALINKGTHDDSEQPEFERKDAAEMIDLIDAIEQEVVGFKLELSQKATA